MAMNALGLGFVFTAKNFASTSIMKLNRDFKQLDRTVDKTASKIRASLTQRLLTGVGMVTAGAAGLKAGFDMAAEFGDFEQGLARVYAVTGASADEMARLKDSVIKAGVETQFSPDEAVKGMNELVTRGLTVQDSIQALKPALDLAAAGQMSIAQAGSTTAAALKTFGLQADQAADAANKLLKIETLTALKSKDLEIALGTVGRGAGLTNQSLTETLTMLGLVRNTGLETSASATAVSTALLMMAKNSAKLEEQLGVKISDANGNFRDMGDIVLEVGRKLEADFPDAAERARKATELFNMRGLTGFGAVYKQLTSGVRTASGDLVYGAEALDYMRNNLDHSAGATEEFKDKLNATFRGQIDLLEGVLKTFLLGIGEPLADVLYPMLEGMRGAIIQITQVIQSLPAGFKNFIAKTLLLGSAFVFVTGAVLTLIAGFQALQLAKPLIIGAFAPIMPFILPIMAGIAAAVLLFKTFKSAFKMDAGLAASFENMGEKLMLLLDAMKQLFATGELSGDVLRKMLGPENAGVRAVFETIAKIKSRVEGFLEGLSAGFKAAASKSAPAFMFLKNMIIGVVKVIAFLIGGVVDLGPEMDTAAGLGVALGQAIGFIGRVLAIILPFYTAYFVITRGIAIAQGAYNLVLLIGKGLQKAYAAVMFVSETAALGLSVATGGLATATMSLGAALMAVIWPLLAVTATFAAAYVITRYIDEWLGLSNAISDALMSLTGYNKENEKLEKRLGGRTNLRGMAGVEAERGMAGEYKPLTPTQKKLQESLMARGGPGAAGAPIAADAQAKNQAAATVSAKQSEDFDAFLKQLEKTQGKAGDTKLTANLMMDGETFARAMGKVKGSGESTGFTADNLSDMMDLMPT